MAQGFFGGYLRQLRGWGRSPNSKTFVPICAPFVAKQYCLSHKEGAERRKAMF